MIPNSSRLSMRTFWLPQQFRCRKPLFVGKSFGAFGYGALYFCVHVGITKYHHF